MSYQRGLRGGIVLALGLGVLSAGYAQEGATTPPPVWKPQPKLMRYLSSLTRFNGYALQPPRGYAMQQAQRPGFAACAWQAARKRNEITPGLLLTVGPVPTHANKKLTSEQVLAAALTAQQHRYAEWTQSAFEKGQINGLAFLRAYWTATDARSKRTIRGVSYAALDGEMAVLLTGQVGGKAGKADDAKTSDAPSNAQETPDENGDEMTPPDVDRLQLAETAIQTFHRVGGVRASTPANTPPLP